MSASPATPASVSRASDMARIIGGPRNERQSPTLYSAPIPTEVSMKGTIVAAAAAIGLLAAPAPAQTAAPAPPPGPTRPTVVRVLPGGGARGSAHIGVIKVLEEYHVPIDLVVGTSMGSIVGGLYASGWSVEEIEQKITTID